MGGGGTEHQFFRPDLFKIDLDQIISAHGSHFDDHTFSESLVADIVTQSKARQLRGLLCGSR